MRIFKAAAFSLALLAISNWQSTRLLAQHGEHSGGHNGGGGGGGGNSSHASAGHDNGGSGHSSASIQGHGDSGSNRSAGSHDDGNNLHESHQAFFRGSPDNADNDRNGRDNSRDRNSSNTFGNRGNSNRDRDNNNWSQFSDRVRSDWGRRDRNDLPFVAGWWGNYRNDRWPAYGPYASSRWGDRPYYWWGGTPVGRLTSWLAFGWDRPRYWSYGPDANIYCQDDYVYYDGERYEPIADYYQQIYDLAHSVPKISEQDAKDMDWAPLGVFAVARDIQQNDDPQRTIQLAVNKEGVLSGTFFNAEKKGVHPVTGMVDERTQRAAWSFADGDHPKLVFETSVNNLTKSNATMMVHYGPSQSDTEVWHLVRLERPEASQQAGSNDQSRNEGNDLP